MKNYSVYLIINPKNNKKYVGCTRQKPEHRWKNGNGYKNNVEFYADIVKYGWDSFIRLVLYEGLDKESAELLEEKLIKLFNSVEEGYNVSYGVGGKGLKFTDEHKRNLSKNHANVKGKNHPKARAVICVTTGRIFDTIAEATKFYNIKGHHISECCQGKRKSTGKLPNGKPLVWMYLDDYEKQQKPFWILRIKDKIG